MLCLFDLGILPGFSCTIFACRKIFAWWQPPAFSMEKIQPLWRSDSLTPKKVDQIRRFGFFLEDHPQLGSSTYLVTVSAIYGSPTWKGSHKTPGIGDRHDGPMVVWIPWKSKS